MSLTRPVPTYAVTCDRCGYTLDHDAALNQWTTPEEAERVITETYRWDVQQGNVVCLPCLWDLRRIEEEDDERAAENAEWFPRESCCNCNCWDY